MAVDRSQLLEVRRFSQLYLVELEMDNISNGVKDESNVSESCKNIRVDHRSKIAIHIHNDI